MRAEVAKLRYLPLPRWTAAAVLAVTILAGAALFVFKPSDPAEYANVPGTAVSLAFTVAGIVFGAWLATLESSAGTLQLTLTAESDRRRILADKMAIGMLAVVAVGIAAAAAGAGLGVLAGTETGVGVDKGEVIRNLVSVIPSGVVFAGVGFAFGLLTRSLGGGITLALAFAFVINGVLTLIPTVGKYSLAQLIQDLTNAIAGAGETTNGVVISLVGLAIWSLALTIPGWIRFNNQDLK